MVDPTSLEARVARLEAIEDIRAVLHDYCHFYDTGWDGAGRDPDRVAALFTEDAIWDAGTIAPARGRAAIRDWCATYGHAAGMSVHIMMNPKIEVDGDRATGAWTGLCPLVSPENEALWIGGRYLCDLVRAPDGWKIAHMRFLTAFLSPYEEGFAKVRIFQSKSYD